MASLRPGALYFGSPVDDGRGPYHGIRACKKSCKKFLTEDEIFCILAAS